MLLGNTDPEKKKIDPGSKELNVAKIEKTIIVC